MKFKNTKIANQLSIGLSIILIFTIIMGAFSLYASNTLWQNTKTIYEHPFTVRKAIDALDADVLNIRLEMKEIVITNKEQTTQLRQQDISAFEADAYKQFETIYSAYLGPKSDIDKAYSSFVQWKPIRDETVRLMLAGKTAEAMQRTSFEGISGVQAIKVVNEISVISNFADNKAVSLYNDAQMHKNQMLLETAGTFAAVILVLIIISNALRRSILTPLKILTAAVKAFQRSEPDVKSSYESKNEFGVLSGNFNEMVDTVQSTIRENEIIAEISEAMVMQNELHPFCEELLKALLLYTDSQLGAIYIENEETKSFDYYESIGLSSVNRAAFSLADKEGEFGTALASGEVQHIKDIPADARLTFSAVSGDYQIREIMTIPAMKGNEVVAVISIAGIKKYSESHVRIVDHIAGEISARLNGVLASQKIMDFSEKLQITNAELEQKTTELSMQTNELTEQNIELEMQKKQLDEASKLKSTFLSNMSHELRTPLNSVIALTSVLNRRLQGKIPEEEYSYLDVIERNGLNLLTLVNDILNLSRIEAGKDEIILNHFHMKNLAAEVTDLLLPLAHKKGVALINSITGDEFAMVSDREKCRHILQNILSNAVKFTDKGEVEISAETQKDNLHITVRDTGIGIAQDQLAYIFDEFRQADESPSRRFGGTGLGLAIAEKYSKQLGGNITAESVLGKGSVFTVILPLKIQPAELQEKENLFENMKPANGTGQSSLTGKRGKRILLVEDSEPAIIQTTDILLEQGYLLSVARSGKEALQLIGEVLPDGIILDLTMPEMDGFQVLKAIRELDKFAHVPVLILSAKHITKDELSFLKSNHVFQLIQKGAVDKKELLAAIEGLVSSESIKTAEAPKKPVRTKGEKPVILVVEDNPDNMITVEALLKEDYIVEKATDGKMGVEQVRKVKPSLVLMDISLPGMNGFEAFTEIKGTPELGHIPIVAMTASAMAGNKEEILAYGFDGYISKPIDLNEMEEVIWRCLNGK